MTELLVDDDGIAHSGRAPTVVSPPALAQIVEGAGVDGTVVFAGYGFQLEGTFVVPDGTMIRIPQPPDGRLLDYHGVIIERTGRVPPALLTEGYWPGMRAPNLVLVPPRGLQTLATSTTVTAPTALADLLRADMGVCLWAACRIVG